MWSSLEKVVAIAGSCVVAAMSSQSDPGTLVGGAMGAAGLIAFWHDRRSTRGPENVRRLRKIRRALLSDIEGRQEWASFDDRLGEALPKCLLDRDALARSAVSGAGFPWTATQVVLDALAERDPLFAAKGEEANPHARQFAQAVIERALELAWADKDYFASFQRALLK
jgi:hypothetical protein